MADFLANECVTAEVKESNAEKDAFANESVTAASDEKQTEAETVNEETKAKAEALKAEGNTALQGGKMRIALEKYTEAIETCPSAVYHSNRAVVYLKQEQFGLAILDADSAIELDPKYIKSYYRRGSANFALGKYKAALKDFKFVAKLKPKDKDARDKLKKCEKARNEAAFAAAIASEQTMPLCQQIDPTAIEVPATYDGPSLPSDYQIEDRVPESFVHEMMEHFRSQKNIHKKYATLLLLSMQRLLAQTPTLVHIPAPLPNSDTDSTEATESKAAGKDKVKEAGITVFGDTHGQFYDFCHALSMVQMPSPTNVLVFNGDFVDRGSFSAEVVFALFAMKLCWPDFVHLTRGNHESKRMNMIYGFEGEVKHKYDAQIMLLFTEVFNHLPLSLVLHNQVFIVHGGLPSYDGVKLADIAAIPRIREPPETGLMSDLLWSDPHPFPGWSPSKRGVGKAFGPDVTDRFLRANNLRLVVRSHEVKDEGFVVEHDGKCITVFSAPNYCDQMGNKAAYLFFSSAALLDGEALVGAVDEHKPVVPIRPEITSYAAVGHPPVKPMAYASGAMSFGL